MTTVLSKKLLNGLGISVILVTTLLSFSLLGMTASNARKANKLAKQIYAGERFQSYSECEQYCEGECTEMDQAEWGSIFVCGRILSYTVELVQCSLLSIITLLMLCASITVVVMKSKQTKRKMCVIEVKVSENMLSSE